MKGPTPLAWVVVAVLVVGGVAGGVLAIVTVRDFVAEPFPRATAVPSGQLIGEWNHYETPNFHSRLTLESDGTFTIDSLPTEVLSGKLLSDDTRETRWANVARGLSGVWVQLGDGNLQLRADGVGLATVYVNRDGSDITLSAPLRTAYDEWGSSCFTYSPSGDHLHGSCG